MQLILFSAVFPLCQTLPPEEVEEKEELSFGKKLRKRKEKEYWRNGRIQGEKVINKIMIKREKDEAG